MASDKDDDLVAENEGDDVVDEWDGENWEDEGDEEDADTIVATTSSKQWYQ